MTSAQNINSQRARLWLPLDTQFRQDVGANLVVDGDMEAVGTGAYAASDALLAKVGGAYVGSQCLQVTTTVVNGSAYQVPCVVSTNYSLYGAGTGDGVNTARVVCSATLWTSTASELWQPFSVKFTAASTILRFGYNALGAVSKWDDLKLYEYPLTTLNLGGASGAPTYVRMGDGHTASTSPSQIVGSRGVRLDGGDYMRAPIDFDRNQAFTIAVLTNSTFATEQFMAATHDSATNIGVRFGALSSRRLYGYIADNGGRYISVEAPANSIPLNNAPRLFCMSYNGGLSPGSITMSIDGVVIGGVGAGTALASSISSGRDMLIGARWNAATPTSIMAASSILWAGEFPTVLSMYELRLLKARLMREIRAGA